VAVAPSLSISPALPGDPSLPGVYPVHDPSEVGEVAIVEHVAERSLQEAVMAVPGLTDDGPAPGRNKRSNRRVGL
jgi:hypothetical protein